MQNCYISLDYATQSVEIYKKIKNKITKKCLTINKEEPLKKEILEFINLVKKKSFDISYAEKAKNALKIACKIEKIIQRPL